MTLTTIRELSGKQKALLPGLILCLVDRWTKTLDPMKDLKNLNIGPDVAREAIQESVERRYLKNTVECLGVHCRTTQIVTQPEKFRGVDIFTERGRKNLQKYDFNVIAESWQIAIRDEKFMAVMRKPGVR